MVNIHKYIFCGNACFRYLWFRADALDVVPCTSQSENVWNRRAWWCTVSTVDGCRGAFRIPHTASCLCQQTNWCLGWVVWNKLTMTQYVTISQKWSQNSRKDQNKSRLFICVSSYHLLPCWFLLVKLDRKSRWKCKHCYCQVLRISMGLNTYSIRFPINHDWPSLILYQPSSTTSLTTY